MYNILNRIINAYNRPYNINNIENANIVDFDASLSIFYTPVVFYNSNNTNINNTNINNTNINNTNINSINSNNLLFILFDISNNNTCKKLTTTREIGDIKKIIYNTENSIKYNIPDECPITLEKFNVDQEVCYLKCGHCFEPTAIFEWLKKSSNQCPICRYSLNSQIIKIKDD